MTVITLSEAETLAEKAPRTATVTWLKIDGKIIKLTINGVDFEVVDD